MYISVVCFASWMIASCYKHSEPNYKLVSPVTHLTVVKPVALTLDASPCFIPRACQQGCFSPLSSPGWVNGICYISLLKWCWGKISKWAAVSFQQFSLLWPLAFVCEYIRLGIMQVWESRELVDSSFFLFLHYWEKMTWTLVKSLPLWWWRNNL